METTQNTDTNVQDTNNQNTTSNTGVDTYGERDYRVVREECEWLRKLVDQVMTGEVIEKRLNDINIISIT